MGLLCNPILLALDLPLLESGRKTMTFLMFRHCNFCNPLNDGPTCNNITHLRVRIQLHTLQLIQNVDTCAKGTQVHHLLHDFYVDSYLMFCRCIFCNPLNDGLTCNNTTHHVRAHTHAFYRGIIAINT